MAEAHPHEFTLRLPLDRELTGGEIDALHEAGLSDAGIETGPAGTTLDVSRQGPSKAAAVASAIADVAKVPGLPRAFLADDLAEAFKESFRKSLRYAPGTRRLTDNEARFLLRRMLTEHDQTLGDLFAVMGHADPSLTPSGIGALIEEGIGDGVIEDLDDGTFRWKGDLPEHSRVAQWERWLRDLETSQRPVSHDLSITLRAARDAIAELQGQLAEKEKTDG